MEIHRTVIDHANDRIEATGRITYIHPVTQQEVTEDYTVTMKESEALAKEGWTNADEAAAVSAALSGKGLAVTATVAVPQEKADIPLTAIAEG